VCASHCFCGGQTILEQRFYDTKGSAEQSCIENTSRAGGKYTWGSVMDREGDAAVDPRDPNYDSGDDKSGVSYHLQLSVQIKMYKQSVRDLTPSLSRGHRLVQRSLPALALHDDEATYALPC
jgi:hypothetical protein